MNIDISTTPFSRFGSYIGITHDPHDNTLTVHNAQRRFAEGEALVISFGCEVTVTATQSRITIVARDGEASIVIPDDESFLIQAMGIAYEIHLCDRNGYGHEVGDNRFEMISVGRRQYHLITVLKGSAALHGETEDGPLHREHRTMLSMNDDQPTSLVARITQTENWTLPAELDHDSIAAAVQGEWHAFLDLMPEVPSGRRDIAETTWFNLWSCFVRARDCYHYDVMLMSKKFMSSVWSWDHCFNALALANTMPQKAYEQFLAPFELQSESGALPDMWNPNSEIVWGVTKPPIHGWCFSRLMDQIRFDRGQLEKVYDHLEGWTRWWMEYRDNDADGVPCYPQGCDSGWDNSTSFDLGYFIETPDLPAYLILQMQCLARIAGELDRQSDAETWRQSATELTSRFIEHSWEADRFVSRQSNTHRVVEDESSLIAFMPIVMGEHLDGELMDRLVQRLQSEHLTDHGLATERPTSRLYEPDGYWRGPIWAPVTYLIVDGLRRAGHDELARTIATRFCDMIQHIAGGNFENFDALTGRGLRAPGYTWTASVNMLLMSEFG